MAGQQRGRRAPSTRGDFTGNKKEALAREHAEQVEARREELGTINQTKETVKQEGVIDMMGATPTLDLGQPAPPIETPAVVSPPLNGVEGDGEDGPTADATLQGAQIDTTLREPTVVQPEQPAPPQGTRIGSSTASIDVFELEPEKPKAAAQVGEALTPDMQNEPTLIRSIYDLEDVTIGYGNTFTFREGYKYRVPRWVAAHLEEKGLCDVLSLSMA